MTRGRPSNGLSERVLRVPVPAVVELAIKEMAAREGVKLAEYVRRAIRVRMGWHEVVPAAKAPRKKRRQT